MPKRISKKRAEELWTDLRDGFVNQEKVIKEIVATEAWTKLGYESFSQAWRERMKGVRLAADGLKAAVVYAMFETENTAEKVMESLGDGVGVTPRTVNYLKRQKDQGVPAELASTHLRGQRREPDDIPDEKAVVVTFPYDDWLRYRELTGSTIALAKLMRELTDAHFQERQRGVA